MSFRLDDGSTRNILGTDLNQDGKPDIIESNSHEKNIYYFNRLAH